MQLALRGLGATVVNPDGTISVTIDPNAGNITPVVTTPKNAINYGAMASGAPGLTQAEFDAIQADIWQLAPGTAIDSPAALQAAEATIQAQALGLAPGSTACVAGQVLSGGV
jgi:hypothetical protein